MQMDGISSAVATMTQGNLTRTAQRAGSLRTAVVLALVALMFFGGIIAAQGSAWSVIGIGALGFAFIGFPLALMVSRVRA